MIYTGRLSTNILPALRPYLRNAGPYRSATFLFLACLTAMIVFGIFFTITSSSDANGKLFIDVIRWHGQMPRFIQTGSFWLVFTPLVVLISGGWLHHVLTRRAQTFLTLICASEALASGKPQRCDVTVTREFLFLNGNWFYSATLHTRQDAHRHTDEQWIPLFPLPQGWRRTFREECAVYTGRHQVTVIESSHGLLVSRDDLARYLDAEDAAHYRARQAPRLGIPSALQAYLPYPWREYRGLFLLLGILLVAGELAGVVINILTTNAIFQFVVLISAVAILLTAVRRCWGDLVTAPKFLRQAATLLDRPPAPMHAVFTREYLTDATPHWRATLTANDGSEPLDVSLHSPVDGQPLDLPDEEDVTVYRDDRPDGVLLIETTSRLLVSSPAARRATMEALLQLSPPPRRVPEALIGSVLLSHPFVNFGLWVLFVDAALQLGTLPLAGLPANQPFPFSFSILFWGGMIALIVGWFNTRSSIRYLLEGKIALATLKEKRRERQRSNGTMQDVYHLIYEYPGDDGRSVQMTTTEAREETPEAHPRTALVFYSPQNPEDARFIGRWFSTLIDCYIANGELHWNGQVSHGRLLFPLVVLIMQALTVSLQFLR